jgi:hypothetical protein
MSKQLLALILAMASCYGEVTLDWDPSSPNDEIIAYKVYRVKGTVAEFIAYVRPPDTHFIAGGYLCADNPTTVFYVTAVNMTGESFPSNYVGLKTW